MFKRRKARSYPGPLADADALEFVQAVGLAQSVQVWGAIECVQWDGRLAGHTRDDCKLGVAPTTTHLVLLAQQGQPTPIPIAELAVSLAPFGTQAFVYVRDGDGHPVTLSMTKWQGQTLVELLVSLGASQVSAPRGTSVAKLGSEAWSH